MLKKVPTKLKSILKKHHIKQTDLCNAIRNKVDGHVRCAMAPSAISLVVNGQKQNMTIDQWVKIQEGIFDLTQKYYYLDELIDKNLLNREMEELIKQRLQEKTKK